MSTSGVILSCVSYGLVLGMQESIYRAATTQILCFWGGGAQHIGFFNVMLGAGTFVSRVVFGYMLDVSVSTKLMLGFVLLADSSSRSTIGG